MFDWLEFSDWLLDQPSSSSSGVPSNALLDEAGMPILDENNAIILDES